MRLFTGIAIAPEVLEKLARVLDELRPLAKVNWSPVENLHITTKFIGAWPEARLAELKKTLEGLHFGKACGISIAKFGYFPNPHRPNAFFAGVQAGPELEDLAGRMDDALLPLGVAKEERRFTPHLTLARIKNGDVRQLQRHIAGMTDFDFGKFVASEYGEETAQRLFDTHPRMTLTGEYIECEDPEDAGGKKGWFKLW